MKVKIKKLCENAVIPQYAHETDAGLDLVATSIEYNEYGQKVYHTGIALEIPEGYVGLLFPRSSVHKTYMDLTNCVGVIDSGYRGEITMVYRTIHTTVFPAQAKCAEDMFTSIINGKGYKLSVWHHWDENVNYKVGDRIGQLIIMPYPKIEFEEVDELSESDRGANGYGSSGN